MQKRTDEDKNPIVRGLWLAKKQFEFIIRSMNEVVIAIDAACRVVLLNRPAEEIFGVKNSFACGKPVTEVIKQVEVAERMMQVVKHGVNEKDEIRITCNEKERIFTANFAAVKKESGSPDGCVAVLSDITETKQIDAMKSDFLNMVSHELRTPLTPILAYAELLVTDDPDREKTKRYANVITREISRLATLINDLLDLSRIEAGKGLSLALEKGDLTEVIRSVASIYKNYTNKHSIVLDVPKTGAEIMFDSFRLVQVLTNLISNAIKYSPEGGDIRITYSEAYGCANISVADTGMGIPADELPQIFDKFYRVKSEKNRKIGGAGIGLSIVKHLVELHKGTIDVKSEPGKGSVFTISIPKAAEVVLL
jgi:PAS domain S-box-containing protein